MNFTDMQPLYDRMDSMALRGILTEEERDELRDYIADDLMEGIDPTLYVTCELDSYESRCNMIPITNERLNRYKKYMCLGGGKR